MRLHVASFPADPRPVPSYRGALSARYCFSKHTLYIIPQAGPFIETSGAPFDYDMLSSSTALANRRNTHLAGYRT
jgi:hypothetical protein